MPWPSSDLFSKAAEALDFSAGQCVEDRLPLLVGKGRPSRDLVQRPKTADTQPTLGGDATNLNARASYGWGLGVSPHDRRCRQASRAKAVRLRVQDARRGKGVTPAFLACVAGAADETFAATPARLLPGAA